MAHCALSVMLLVLSVQAVTPLTTARAALLTTTSSLMAAVHLIPVLPSTLKTQLLRSVKPVMVCAMSVTAPALLSAMPVAGATKQYKALRSNVWQAAPLATIQAALIVFVSIPLNL